MTTIAPPALSRFAQRWEDAIDGAARRDDAATFSGIIGDAAHRDGGYHISREDQLYANDYSIQLAEDKRGQSNWASAVDMNMLPTQMKIVTARLLASAKDQDDPRLNVCREFYGTLDSKSVVGWDTYYGEPSTADDTHLWHVHLSVLRQYANDEDALNGVLDVIIGVPWREDMEQTDKLIAKTAYAGRNVGDVLGDLSNLRDWLIGEIPSPLNPARPAGTTLPTSSPLAKLLAAAERPPVTVDATAVAKAIEPIIVKAVADELARRMAN